MKFRVFSKLSRLRPSDIYLFLEASLFLTLASIVRITIPLRWYAPVFGRHMEIGPEIAENDGVNCKTYAIVKAIRRGCRYLPFECKCLVRAIASKAMLRLRDIKSTVYLGVAKNEEDKLIAHAWVRVGKMYVTGGNGENNYKIISTFADDNDAISRQKYNDTKDDKSFSYVKRQ